MRVHRQLVMSWHQEYLAADNGRTRFDAARVTGEVFYGVGTVLAAATERMRREGSRERLNFPVCQNFTGGERVGRTVGRGQEVLGWQLVCVRLTVFVRRTEPLAAYIPRAGWLFRAHPKFFQRTAV
jgi:hypothetical protein